MKRESIIHLTIATLFTLAAIAPPVTQGKSYQDRKQVNDQHRDEMKDEIEDTQKAANVFSEIMGTPDKGIPQNLLDDAECVLVFPNVIKAALIVGGQGGSGVASCRSSSGWSAPAYFNLGGGSIGWQIGGESTDYVLLVMNQDGINTLLKNKFQLGADASIAAGPVGRQTGASTDIALNAQMLSYSRTKGLFAGIALKGAVIKVDDSDMRDVYGANVQAKDVLQGNRIATPASVRAFPETLGRYSMRSAASRSKQK